MFFDGVALESGDFSGPTGARTALRQPGARAAVLETARGGLLRRGLALDRADVAVVTNVSPDHFGEYGVHDLDDLARVKLTVARAIDARGILVLNADDPVLVRESRHLGVPTAWFALDFDGATLDACRDQAVATCGVRDGRLRLLLDDTAHDLGDVAAMPLSLGGRAPYNVANIAAAALAAVAAGVAPAAVAATLARFGATHEDNPGRLQHWRFGELQAYVDYAHNPDGLRGFLRAIDAGQRRRAARHPARPCRQPRGRRPPRGRDHGGRVPAGPGGAEGHRRLRARPRGRRGRGAAETPFAVPASRRPRSRSSDEDDAARRALAWARPGDVLVLPLHSREGRGEALALLERLRREGWKAGQSLPSA